MIVVDAGVLVAGTTGGGPARELMAAEDLHAPHGVGLEVTARLGRLVDDGHIDAGTAGAALEVLEHFGIAWHPGLQLLPRVLELRPHAAAYDAACVALAETLGVGLATTGAHLAQIPDLGCPVTVLTD